MTSFTKSQLQYCPLAFIFHSRKRNTKFKKLHERAIRIRFIDQEPSFEDLLGLHNSVTAHQKNLQVSMIELFKTRHGLNPSFINEIFSLQTNLCSLRNDHVLILPKVISIA